MSRSPWILVAAVIVLASSLGCDKVAACKEREDEVYRKAVAACKADAACIKKADQSRKDFYEACEESGKKKK